MNEGFIFKYGGLQKRSEATGNDAAGSSAASVEPTKVCLGCGRELPLSAFHLHNKSKDGHGHLCMECCKRRTKKEVAKTAKSNPLAKFTARELMHELKARGYESVLEYTVVQKIDIAEM